jgi:hypothetical protein
LFACALESVIRQGLSMKQWFSSSTTIFGFCL